MRYSVTYYLDAVLACCVAQTLRHVTSGISFGEVFSINIHNDFLLCIPIAHETNSKSDYDFVVVFGDFGEIFGDVISCNVLPREFILIAYKSSWFTAFIADQTHIWILEFFEQDTALLDERALAIIPIDFENTLFASITLILIGPKTGPDVVCTSAGAECVQIEAISDEKDQQNDFIQFNYAYFECCHFKNYHCRI